MSESLWFSWTPTKQEACQIILSTKDSVLDILEWSNILRSVTTKMLPDKAWLIIDTFLSTTSLVRQAQLID